MVVPDIVQLSADVRKLSAEATATSKNGLSNP
jgi:hypothetical protein